MTFLTKHDNHDLYHDLFPSRREFDIFDNFFNLDPWTSGTETYAKNKYRWDETDEAYKLDMVMPGITKRDIDITFKNETLSIKCNKEVSEKDQKFLGFRTEQTFKNFPNTIDSSNISAEMSDGVLTITLPKRESDKPKTIEIR